MLPTYPLSDFHLHGMSRDPTLCQNWEMETEMKDTFPWDRLRLKCGALAPREREWLGEGRGGEGGKGIKSVKGKAKKSKKSA